MQRTLHGSAIQSHSYVNTPETTEMSTTLLEVEGGVEMDSDDDRCSIGGQ